jgi:hypothetical protein
MPSVVNRSFRESDCLRGDNYVSMRVAVSHQACASQIWEAVNSRQDHDVALRIPEALPFGI